MMGWQDMDNMDLDWLTISSILGTLIFVLTNTGIFLWLLRFRPQILRSRGVDRIETTLNWKVIGEIMLQCISFSGGIVLLLNTAVFMITGIWNLDATSLGVLALAFALMLFRSFDAFLTTLLKGRM